MQREKKSHARKRLEIIGIISLYAIFDLSYSLALYVVSNGSTANFLPVLLDYSLKGILTVPVFWFIFHKMKDSKGWARYMIHLITLPLWLFAWIKSYYFLCDLFDIYHLQGKNAAWDVYIPFLFYIIQFGIFHLYDESKRLQNQEQKALELSELALRSELKALKSQLNPHFLYNVFNTINASLPPKEEHTRELIAKLADLFRYQLMASKKEWVKLQEEVDFVRKYLELEHARFEDRLSIDWDIDPSLLNEAVPPMILQPIVENALNHGIAPLIEGGSLIIRIYRDQGNMFFEVIDDGVGLNENALAQSNGLGLANTRKRLERLYGTRVELRANKPNGLIVSFQIPLASSKELALSTAIS